MARVRRDAAVASGAVNVDEFNPLRGGERIIIAATGSAAGQHIDLMVGGTNVCNADLGVETALGNGPIMPDNVILEWVQAPQSGNQNISIVLTGAGTTGLYIAKL